MGTKTVNRVWRLKEKPKRSDMLVLIYLASRKNEKTLRCFPSADKIARDCDMSRRTVFESLNRLEFDRELIRRVPRYSSNGRQTSNQINFSLDGVVERIEGDEMFE